MSVVISQAHSGAGNRLSRAFGRWVFKGLGWQAKGEIPDHPKLILAVAPHTSNWDFFVAIAFVLSEGIRVRFIGKHSIFVFPVKYLLFKLGGIPVNRAQSNGTVGQIADYFANSQTMAFGVAPEGTRSYLPEWKTGFLHISQAAQVPVILVTLDFTNKTLELGPDFGISTDIDKDLQRIKQASKRAIGKRPKNTP